MNKIFNWIENLPTGAKVFVFALLAMVLIALIVGV
jgi:hypothetical protein